MHLVYHTHFDKEKKKHSCIFFKNGLLLYTMYRARQKEKPVQIDHRIRNQNFSSKSR